MPHGRRIYAKAYDMGKSTMCAYSQSDHALPHWKYLLRYCSQCPSINIPEQETYGKYPNPSHSISFHIYHLIVHCKKHDMLPLTDNKSCQECQKDTASVKPTKI